MAFRYWLSHAEPWLLHLHKSKVPHCIQALCVRSEALETLIWAWISNHMPGKVWDEITYPFLNFNCLCSLELTAHINTDDYETRDPKWHGDITLLITSNFMFLQFRSLPCAIMNGWDIIVVWPWIASCLLRVFAVSRQWMLISCPLYWGSVHNGVFRTFRDLYRDN